MTGARTWILEQLDAERGRWMLWLPVAMGLGIAVYFELPSEPALWLGPAIAGGGASPSRWRRPAARRGRSCIGAGRGGVRLRARRRGGPPSLAAPTLSRPLFSINVEGRIADIQRLPGGRAGRARGGAAEGHRVPPPEMMPARAAGVAGQGRAAARRRRPDTGAGQPLAARRAGRAGRLRFPAGRLVPAARRGRLRAGAGRVIERGSPPASCASSTACAPTSPSAS